MTKAVEKVWTKIFISMSHDDVHLIDHSGFIPVFDGSNWKVFRNSMTIFPGAENCADPAKVDVLRQNVVSLLDHYPDTLPQLEKLGVRVRALLNREIKTYEDVVAWKNSLFNFGPFKRLPDHISDTIDLAYDDIIIEVKGGRSPFYVIPAAPRGSGVVETLDFTWPGAKRRYGPRHEFTKTAFAMQIPKKPPRYRGKTAEGEPQRPRGRPRKDGLVPGSPEAKKADQKKEAERLRKARIREATSAKALKAKRNGKNGHGTITELPNRRTKLKRKAEYQQATG